jgi:hypothetical protein
MQGGAETGETLVGHAGLQLQNDAVTKMHFGHLTYYSGAEIYNPLNIHKVNNIFCERVLGGGGWKVIDPAEYDFKTGKVGLDMGVYRASVMVVPIPYEMTFDDFESCIDITGRWTAAENSSGFIDPENLAKIHYPSAWRLNQIYHITSRSDVLRDPTNNNPGFFSEQNLTTGEGTPFANRVVFRGRQFNWNVKAGAFTDEIKNAGHWGDAEGHGALAARNGKLTNMRLIGRDSIVVTP